MACASRNDMYSVMGNTGFGNVIIISNGSNTAIEFNKSAMFSDGRVKKSAMQMAKKVINSGEITKDKIVALASKGVVLRVNF